MERVESDVEAFLFSHTGPIFDVRSPCEFAKGSIPGSLSLPLFSDEERHEVGVCYKQKGKKEAVLLGLSFVGPKMRSFADAFLQHSQVRLLCFRGGMRSSSMSWLSELVGTRVIRLDHGYKAYRKWVLETVQKPFEPCILSGPTGSGKTEIIQMLHMKGIPTLDLEQLANHRGSAFGGFLEHGQPTQENFENNLAHALHPLLQSPYICVEAESRSIGRIVLPRALYDVIHSGPVVVIDCPFEERLERIVQQYGSKPKEELIQSVEKIQKRLGGQADREAIAAIQEGRISDAARILLCYYDATYEHCLKKHTGIQTVFSRKEIIDGITQGRFEEFVQSVRSSSDKSLACGS